MTKTNVKQHVDSVVFARSVLQQRYLDAGRRIKDSGRPVDSKLEDELVKLKSIFAKFKNGYPLDLLTRLVRRLTQRDVLFGPKRCPFYLKLPWKGPWSSSMSRAIASAAQSAYCAVNVNCVFTTSRTFNLKKDVCLPNTKVT